MVNISKAFDDIISAIKSELKDKTNPRTNKPYTDSDIYSIAVSAFKKKYGKNPSDEKKENVIAENVRVNFNSYLEVLE